MNNDVKQMILENLRKPCYGESVRIINDRMRSAANMVESLFVELEQVKQERDALMEDFNTYRIRNIQKTYGVYACDMCKYGGDLYKDKDAGTKCPEGCGGLAYWQWRGVQNYE